MNKSIIFSILMSINASVSYSSPYKTDSLEQAEQLLNTVPTSVKEAMESAPSVYNFVSTFDGQPNVSHTGQTFRQILINDIKGFLSSEQSGAYPGEASDAFEAIYSFYDYDFENNSFAFGAINGISDFRITAKGLDGAPMEIFEGEVYDDLQFKGKQLKNKTAGNDNALRHNTLLGWNTFEFNQQNLRTINVDGQGDAFIEPEDLLQAWMNVMAKNMSEGRAYTVSNGGLADQRITSPYILENGIDLKQLMQKFLFGAVNFSQAAGDYLSTDLSASKGLNGSDSEAYSDGSNATVLEHHWDEAFGYFGAARDYLNYTDAELKAKVSIDSNNDGQISLVEEKNYTFAINAGRFDATSTTPKTSFSEDIMQGFLQGRQLIQSKPNGYRPFLKAIAVKLLANWEAVNAATVIHYINVSANEIGSYGTSEYLFQDLAKFWSEMKGFAFSFQFNPESVLSTEGFIKFHELVGDAPVIPNGSNQNAVSEYQNKLMEARKLLQDVYGFSDQNVANW